MAPLPFPAILAVLLALSFAPPILFAVWIRNTERYHREPWGVIGKTFVFGAIFAVVIAVIFSLLLLVLVQRISYLYVVFGRTGDPQTLVLAIVVAPFAEEAAKLLALFGARRWVTEVEDAMIYGASSGLGFAATENLLYGLGTFLTFGIEASLGVIAIRSVSSVFLHASASATAGLGVGKRWVGGRALAVVPYYLLAVVMHAAFNFLASLGISYEVQYGEVAALVGFVAALALALVAIVAVRSAIASTDKASLRRPRR